MGLPAISVRPPFDITRASHLVLTVADLDVSRRFYTEVVGLLVSDEVDGVLYLRGVEETSHHSLVLRRSDAPAVCERVGVRVFTDDDVSAALEHFKARGLAAARVDVAFQGPTVQVSDPEGVRLEVCATMERRPRMLSDAASHRGGRALRMDHFQISVPDVRRLHPFYADLGFRTSDYISDDETGEIFALFLHRKNNPHDLVFTRRSGPLFHHCGYIVPELADIFRACDAAGACGFGHEVERGPGRHGLGHSLFVYLRDPDGHRVELLLPPIQTGDIDEPANRWSVTNGFAGLAWGLPAPGRWFEEAKRFADTPVTPPAFAVAPMTLERYLAR